MQTIIRKPSFTASPSAPPTARKARKKTPIVDPGTLDILGLRLAPSHLEAPTKPTCADAVAQELETTPPPPVNNEAQRLLRPHTAKRKACAKAAAKKSTFKRPKGGKRKLTTTRAAAIDMEFGKLLEGNAGVDTGGLVDNTLTGDTDGKGADMQHKGYDHIPEAARPRSATRGKLTYTIASVSGARVEVHDVKRAYRIKAVATGHAPLDCSPQVAWSSWGGVPREPGSMCARSPALCDASCAVSHAQASMHRVMYMTCHLCRSICCHVYLLASVSQSCEYCALV